MAEENSATQSEIFNPDYDPMKESAVMENETSLRCFVSDGNKFTDRPVEDGLSAYDLFIRKLLHETQLIPENLYNPIAENSNFGGILETVEQVINDNQTNLAQYATTAFKAAYSETLGNIRNAGEYYLATEIQTEKPPFDMGDHFDCAARQFREIAKETGSLRDRLLELHNLLQIGKILHQAVEAQGGLVHVEPAAQLPEIPSFIRRSIERQPAA